MDDLDDRVAGAMVGLAIGDALGAPVDGMSHQAIRTHVRGMKGFETAGPRGAAVPGVHTRRARSLEAALEKDRWDDWVPPAGAAAAACAAPAGVAAHAGGLDDTALTALLRRAVPDAESLAAAVGQARAVALALSGDGAGLDGVAFLDAVAAAALAAGGARVPAALRALAPYLHEPPLDLHDRAGGTGEAPEQAFPFAVAMFAREPALVEASLLSAINAGGATSAVGAIVGSLLGAYNGAAAFPSDWRAAAGGR